MNSIIRPTTRVGVMTVKDMGGEERTIVPIEGAPVEAYKFYSTQEVKRYLEHLVNYGLYDVKNGIWTKKPNYQELQEKRRTLNKVLLNRQERWRAIHSRKFHQDYTVINVTETIGVPSVLNCDVTVIPSVINHKIDYEMKKKGDEEMKIKNKVYDESYTDEYGEFHEKIYKENVVPYTREKGILKRKDILTLHKSGRLGITTNRGVIPTNSYLPGFDDEEAELALGQAIQAGLSLFVFLPVGGRFDKKYEQVPMPDSKYHLSPKKNLKVPLNQVLRRVYKPEIDGKTTRAKNFLYAYRGPTNGLGPVYTYDKNQYMRDFAPHILSYNHVEYTDKMIIVIGTERSIDRIDDRVKSLNKVKNQYHKFTDEKIIGYSGQTSRCTNSRIVMPAEGGRPQVFGLNLKGTPEEELKSYLRSFDKKPYHNNEEALELIEIANNQDGRMTIANIEHSLRTELKYLKAKTSSELYFLIKEVEDEEHSKKIKALLNVLGSFKSSKEIQEQEQDGLTEDLKDLVSIEEKATDSSYKKSKNLFSQQLGILERNQNPLKMEGGFKLLKEKEWTTGGPISFPTNEVIPKRNIPFIQRTNMFKRTVSHEDVQGGMFSRDFSINLKTKRVKTEQGVKRIPVGVKVERNPLFTSFSERRTKVNKHWIGFVLNHPVWRNYLEYLETPKTFRNLSNIMKEGKEFLDIALIMKEEKEEELKRISEKIKISSPNFVPTKVSNFPTYYFTNGERIMKTISCFERTLRVPRMYTKTFIYKNGAMFEGQFKAIKPLHKVVWTKASKMEFQRRNKGRRSSKSYIQRYIDNEGFVSTVRLFDNRNNPGPVYKKANMKQFKEAEKNDYQFSGKIVFDEKKHEFVRVSPHKKPSFQILHTLGNEGEVDCYIININGQTLYAKGDLSLLEKDLISFTGTRNPDRKTIGFVKKTVELLLKQHDYITVTGGAKGCDSMVIGETHKNDCKTIMVLASGFDESNRAIKNVLQHGGLVLSEHPPEYEPSKKDFVLRNKIIAGLSERLIVFQAGKGTMHCAKFGINLGKELLIQPGFRNSSEIVESKKGRFFFPKEGVYPF